MKTDGVYASLSLDARSPRVVIHRCVRGGGGCFSITRVEARSLAAQLLVLTDRANSRVPRISKRARPLSKKGRRR